MFLDASVVVAIVTKEPDAAELKARIENSRTRVRTSPLAAFESALAISNRKRVSLKEAQADVDDLLARAGAENISITPEIGRLAVEARARYGKGTGHPAQLNMGECFAYACARAHGVPLLHKGADFIHTDLA